MVSEMIGPLTREQALANRLYYIIYSIDVRRDAEHIVNWLDPTHIPRTNRDSSPDDLGSQAKLWVQTEGDEQWDFDYLADEMQGSTCGMCGGSGIGQQESSRVIASEDDVIYGVGIHERHNSYFADGEATIWEYRPCAMCAGTGDGGNAYRNGYHRKWVAELNHEQFLVLANDRNWELDEDEWVTDYTDTMGSITEYGHIPAVAVSDEEGWTYNGEIVYAQFYVSRADLRPGDCSEIGD